MSTALINLSLISLSYSILFISDIHYGTVQSSQLVKDSILKMNNLKADIVVLGGDIVDERTSKKDMEEIFNELEKSTQHMEHTTFLETMMPTMAFSAFPETL